MKFSLSIIKHTIVLLFLFSISFSSYANAYTFKFLNTSIEMTDSTDAADSLIINDSYTYRLSPFEIATRLQDSTKNTEQDYLTFAAKQTLNWSQKEQEQIKAAFKKIE